MHLLCAKRSPSDHDPIPSIQRLSYALTLLARVHLAEEEASEGRVAQHVLQALHEGLLPARLVADVQLAQGDVDQLQPPHFLWAVDGSLEPRQPCTSICRTDEIIWECKRCN